MKIKRKLNFWFPLRYKILIFLIASSAISLGIFLFQVKGVFIADKLAYIYSSSQGISKSLTAQIRSDILSAVNLVKPMVQGYSFSAHEFTYFAENFFNNENELISIELLENNGENSYISKTHLAKDNTLFIEFKNLIKIHSATQQLFEKNFWIGPLIEEKYLPLGIRFGNLNEKKSVIIYCLFRERDFVNHFKKSSDSENYIINQSGQNIINIKNTNKSFEDLIQNIIQMKAFTDFVQLKMTQSTQEISYNDHTVIASFVSLGIADLIIINLINYDEAVKGMKILVERFIYLFIILLFVLFIFSILLSRMLTTPLNTLNTATQKVAAGDFKISINLNSNDEIGELGKSFNTMSREISRLIVENIEKTRMEQELLTANTIQSTLFPKDQNFIEHLEISGFYQPASEVGGDWWFYHKNQNKVYFWIGDATGHGTPAALITSAARSVSSILENQTINPKLGLQILNKTIFDVSNGQINMTFFLCEIDLNTNIMTYANASHNTPYLIRKNEGQKLKMKD